MLTSVALYGEIHIHAFAIILKGSAMTNRQQKCTDLMLDKACQLLMARDGVKANDVMLLMNSIRPLVAQDCSYRQHHGEHVG